MCHQRCFWRIARTLYALGAATFVMIGCAAEPDNENALAPAQTDGASLVFTEGKMGVDVFSPRHLRLPFDDEKFHLGLSVMEAHRFEDAMVDDLVDLEADWVRLEISAEGPFGQQAFEIQIEQYAHLLDQLSARGINVLAVLSFSLVEGGVGNEADDDYATQLETSPVVPNSDFNGFGETNQFMDAWIDRALTVLRRYPTQIDAVEVLNEPNKYIGGGGDMIDPETYGRLLTKFYYHCKQEVNDGACGDRPVILGGLHPALDDSGDFDADKPMCPYLQDPPLSGGDRYVLNDDNCYLAAVYRSEQVENYGVVYRGEVPFDGIGYHPYAHLSGTSYCGTGDDPPDSMASTVLGRMREFGRVPEQLSAPVRPVWITEIGSNVTDGRLTLEEKEEIQATYLRLVVEEGLLRPNFLLPQVDVVVWAHYADGPSGHFQDNDAVARARWGLVRHADRRFTELPAQRKPSFCAFRKLQGLSSGEGCGGRPAAMKPVTLDSWSASFFSTFEFTSGANADAYEFEVRRCDCDLVANEYHGTCVAHAQPDGCFTETGRPDGWSCSGMDRSEEIFRFQGDAPISDGWSCTARSAYSECSYRDASSGTLVHLDVTPGQDSPWSGNREVLTCEAYSDASGLDFCRFNSYSYGITRSGTVAGGTGLLDVDGVYQWRVRTVRGGVRGNWSRPTTFSVY